MAWGIEWIGVDHVRVCGFVTCKFIGSVFSCVVHACSSAGAVLAHTTTCHAGETICASFIYVFPLCIYLCLRVSK